VASASDSGRPVRGRGPEFAPSQAKGRSPTSSRRRSAAPTAWAFCLVLAIVSYPGVTAARLAPWAGLAGGLMVIVSAAAAAWLGYARRGRPARGARAASLVVAAAAAVGVVTVAVDRRDALTALVIGSLVAVEILFCWHFVPALAREAQASETARRPSLRLLGRLRPSPGPQAGVTLWVALLIGFLTLGAGGVWARGVSWAPHPAGWLVALLLCALGLMFTERVGLLERSAREGNLLMPSGAFWRWVSAGLAVVLLAGLLALAMPWRPAPAGPGTSWPGNVARLSPSASEEPGLSPPPGGVAPSISEALAAMGAVRRRTLGLLLLLLLLVAALIVMWGFSRTRFVQWLLGAVAALLARLMRAWQRLRAWLGRWFARPAEQTALAPTQVQEGPDPLFDIFEHPEILGRLSPREVLIRAYHLLLSFAEMMGHGRRPGETPFEYLRTLDAAAPQAREAVRVLTWGYSGAMYAAAGANLPQPTAVHHAWEQLMQALKGGMSPEDLDLRRRAYLAARRLEQKVW